MIDMFLSDMSLDLFPCFSFYLHYIYIPLEKISWGVYFEGNCNFAKCEFRQLASFPTKFANFNELSCNSTIVLDMLTDQIESVKMYGSTIMKKYNWRNSHLAKLQRGQSTSSHLSVEQ